MTDADRQLDDDLRRVPLPENLRAALTPEALFADAGIDRLLEAVAVPPGLADRARAAARAGDAPARNGVVDLTRFTVGRGEPAPLSRPAAGVGARQTHGGLRMVREAGRVAAALGLAFVLATAGIRVSHWLEGPGASGPTGAARGPRVVSKADAAPTPPRAAPGPTAGAGSLAIEDQEQHGGIDLGDGPVQRGPPERAVASVLPATQPATDPAPTALAQNLPASAESPAPEPLQVRGAAIPLGDATAMKVVELPRDARRQVSRSAAFDLAFEMTHGESPFVNPAADSSLAVDRPPLTLGTDGFDRLVWGETDRRLRGLSSRIRAEDLLAAMPPPPELVGPDTAAVRLSLVAVRSGHTRDGKPTLFLEAAAFAAGGGRDREAPLEATPP